jgi:hypothetical protein
LNVNYKPKLAFSGGASATPNGIIGYVRQYSATDWDSYYQRTTNWGNTWTTGYIDASTDTTQSCDAQEFKGNLTGQANLTWAVYSANGTYVKSRAFYGTAFGPIYTASVFAATTSFGASRAGVRLGAADSCLTLWAGSNGGGLYSTAGCTGTVTGIGNENNIPLKFSLSQNYPNPFNPTTTIEYSIPIDQFVSLKVFNALGQQVADPVNGFVKAGKYTVKFDAAGMASGIYYYRIEADNNVLVKKMLLLK